VTVANTRILDSTGHLHSLRFSAAITLFLSWRPRRQRTLSLSPRFVPSLGQAIDVEPFVEVQGEQLGAGAGRHWSIEQMTQAPHPFVVRTLLNADGSTAAATSASTWLRIPLACKLTRERLPADFTHFTTPRELHDLQTQLTREFAELFR
jgi:hypothetical protein